MSSRFDDFVRVKEKFPYHGKGVDELLSSLKRILSIPDNKYTQKVVLEVGTPYIYIEKLVPSDEAGKVPTTTLKDIIRSRAMEEYDPESIPKDPWVQLWDMFSIVKKEGLEIGFIAIGSKLTFQKWLGIRIPTTSMDLFGIPVEVVEDLPEDVFVVCGTESRIAEPEDVLFSLKGNIHEANNKTTPTGRADR